MCYIENNSMGKWWYIMLTIIHSIKILIIYSRLKKQGFDSNGIKNSASIKGSVKALMNDPMQDQIAKDIKSLMKKLRHYPIVLIIDGALIVTILLVGMLYSMYTSMTNASIGSYISWYNERQKEKEEEEAILEEEEKALREAEKWSWDEVPDSTVAGGDEGGGTPIGEPVAPIDGFEPGTATGQYAVDLGADGTFFWYHQNGGFGKCSCVYCGDWSNSYWRGSSTKAKSFGSNGCAVYSLAIAVSNLTGKEITPSLLLAKFGCIKTGNTWITNSGVFSGIAIKRPDALKAIKETFGIEYKPVDKTVESIDAILAQGGYVWGSWVDSKCAWCGNGTSHFMCIRKADENSYYCFTSCRGKCANGSNGKDGAVKTMTFPLNKKACIESMTGGQLYGMWLPGATGGDTLVFTKGGNFECPYTKFSCTYMGWQMVTAKSSSQYKWRQSVFPSWVNDKNGVGDKAAFDAEGFGRVNGRYVIAVSAAENGGVGHVGQELDIYLKDGTILKCVVGDIKSAGDANWKKWGHENTSGIMNTIEFIVDKQKWYKNGGGIHANPGTSKCHPNFSSPVKKIVRGKIMPY